MGRAVGLPLLPVCACVACYGETLPCLTCVQALPLSLGKICGNRRIRNVFGRRRGNITQETGT
jgi:hypothetical protein